MSYNVTPKKNPTVNPGAGRLMANLKINPKLTKLRVSQRIAWGLNFATFQVCGFSVAIHQLSARSSSFDAKAEGRNCRLMSSIDQDV